MNGNGDLKPFFKLVKKHAGDKIVEGDVGRVSAKKGGLKWKGELFTSFMSEGKRTIFELIPQKGSFISSLKRFLDRSGLSQGYITCNGGQLSNVRCGFFLTKHKPLPTFAEAMFQGQNKVLSISGFFLRIPSIEDERLTSSIVPHLHITLKDIRNGKRMGGHLIDAEWGRLKCSVVPLSGSLLRRETDPNTRVMHIRSDEAKDEIHKAGEVMIFAFTSGEEFPNKLFKIISSYGVQRATVRFAVGTLWWASLNDEGCSLNKPNDGLELIFAHGELSRKDSDFSHEIDAHLIDKFGRLYRGHLIHGEVKDLIEGVMRFEL